MEASVEPSVQSSMQISTLNSAQPSRAFADAIDAVLPQMQCKQCGYDGCHPYADAVAAGAPINRCPPGGDALVATLASVTGRERIALDRSCGEAHALTLARIDEAICIGCTLCIEACPVDAIVGAAKRMHAVLPALCTGCELCVAPCPVDCIAMVPAGRAWGREDARASRDRYLARNRRVARTATPAPTSVTIDDERQRRQAAIAAALVRARARRKAFDTHRK